MRDLLKQLRELLEARLLHAKIPRDLDELRESLKKGLEEINPSNFSKIREVRGVIVGAAVPAAAANSPAVFYSSVETPDALIIHLYEQLSSVDGEVQNELLLLKAIANFLSEQEPQSSLARELFLVEKKHDSLAFEKICHDPLKESQLRSITHPDRTCHYPLHVREILRDVFGHLPLPQIKQLYIGLMRFRGTPEEDIDRFAAQQRADLGLEPSYASFGFMEALKFSAEEMAPLDASLQDLFMQHITGLTETHKDEVRSKLLCYQVFSQDNLQKLSLTEKEWALFYLAFKYIIVSDNSMNESMQFQVSLLFSAVLREDVAQVQALAREMHLHERVKIQVKKQVLFEGTAIELALQMRSVCMLRALLFNDQKRFSDKAYVSQVVTAIRNIYQLKLILQQFFLYSSQKSEDTFFDYVQRFLLIPLDSENPERNHRFPAAAYFLPTQLDITPFSNYQAQDLFALLEPSIASILCCDARLGLLTYFVHREVRHPTLTDQWIKKMLDKATDPIYRDYLGKLVVINAKKMRLDLFGERRASASRSVRGGGEDYRQLGSEIVDDYMCAYESTEESNSLARKESSFRVLLTTLQVGSIELFGLYLSYYSLHTIDLFKYYHPETGFTLLESFLLYIFSQFTTTREVHFLSIQNTVVAFFRDELLKGEPQDRQHFWQSTLSHVSMRGDSAELFLPITSRKIMRCVIDARLLPFLKRCYELTFKDQNKLLIHFFHMIQRLKIKGVAEDIEGALLIFGIFCKNMGLIDSDELVDQLKIIMDQLIAFYCRTFPAPALALSYARDELEGFLEMFEGQYRTECRGLSSGISESVDNLYLFLRSFFRAGYGNEVLETLLTKDVLDVFRVDVTCLPDGLKSLILTRGVPLIPESRSSIDASSQTPQIPLSTLNEKKYLSSFPGSLCRLFSARPDLRQLAEEEKARNQQMGPTYVVRFL